MKRISDFRTLISGMVRAGVCAAAACAAVWAGTFGKVVPIGGHAADIVLDESRGVLYIANFTANRIEVMNTGDLSIQRSINVAPRPGSMAMSPDNKYLVIGHFGNFGPTAPAPSDNSVTVINLNDNTRQQFTLGFPPLGIAFGID